MFLKTVVSVTLFTSLLGAADPSNSDILSVRSFHDPKTKARIPLTGQLLGNNDPLTGKFFDKGDPLTGPLFSNGDPQIFLTAQAPKSGKCAIPLLEAKHPKTNDAMTKFTSPSRSSPDVVPPPVPACKGWK